METQQENELPAPSQAKIECSKKKKVPDSPKISFPSYPTHGVIGKEDHGNSSMFSYGKDVNGCNNHDHRIRKFDFHETYEKHLINFVPTPIPGMQNTWNNFRKGKRPADLLTKESDSLPFIFRDPERLSGYGYETGEHPLFRTTSSAYGKFPPSVHDVSRVYHGLDTGFTAHLTDTGMTKNRSLNIK